MNSLKYSLIAFYFLLSVAAFGQQQLQLTDKKTGKTKTFKISQNIQYRSIQDAEFEKATIQNITAENIIVLFLPNEDEGNNLLEAPLTSIHSIRKATCFHKTTQAIGALFILGGAYTMASANSLAGEDGSSGPYIGLGAGIFVLGVLPYLIKPKTYILGETHTAEVK